MVNLDKLQTFGQQLFYKLSVTKPEENLFLSVFPLTTLLILLRMTADNKTAHEIDEKFALNGLSTDDIANDYMALWDRLDQNQFVKMSNSIAVTMNHKIVKEIILDAQHTIHAWLYFDVCYESVYLASVYKKEVELVLTTEINFQNRFRTHDYYYIIRNFYATEFETLKVNMLSLITNIQHGKIPQLDAKVFKVPFDEGDISLVILLPNSLQGIKELEQNLQSFPLNSIDKYLSNDWFFLLLPIFETTVEMPLTDGLKHLGMSSMFDRLCDNAQKVKVSDVNYKASFKINVTTFGVVGIDGPEYPIPLDRFKVREINHPFIFFIKSSMNEIYLMGKFMR